MSGLGDWAAAISAGLAGLGLLFVGAQTREAARGTAVTVAQNFVTRASELLEKLDAATSKNPPAENEINIGVQNFLAHFELFVIFIHEAPLGQKMKTMIEDTIIGFLDELAQNNYQDRISKIICRDEDCRELKDFCKQRSARFSDYKIIKTMLRIKGHE